MLWLSNLISSSTSDGGIVTFSFCEVDLESVLKKMYFWGGNSSVPGLDRYSQQEDNVHIQHSSLLMLAVTNCFWVTCGGWKDDRCELCVYEANKIIHNVSWFWGSEFCLAIKLHVFINQHLIYLWSNISLAGLCHSQPCPTTYILGPIRFVNTITSFTNCKIKCTGPQWWHGLQYVICDLCFHDSHT